jgi:hypothetical protein
VARRGFGRPWGQYLGLFVLGLGTAALIYLALTQTGGDGPSAAEDPTLAPASPSASVEPTQTGAAPTPDGEPSAAPTDAPSLAPTPPSVPDQRRADFTAGDGLPDGAALVEGGGNESGLVLTRRGLTHGAPTNPLLAGGLVEVKLDSDVRSLGLRVRFARSNPGAVTLVGWQSSIGAVFDGGGTTPPPTGFRLEATPGSWTLSVLDGTQDVLAEGTYESSGGAETFQIVRQDAQVWVIDPTGATTTATDPRVAELAGPWATWGVFETATDQVPATIEAIWGG